MKKVFKTSLTAFAMALTISFAYATTKKQAPKANETECTWVRTGGQAQPEETNPFVGTKTEAQNYYGCSGTYDECAIGTPTTLGLPQEVIYQH